MARLGDLTSIKTGKLDANAASPDGEYPFFTCSKETLRIASYQYDCECVLVAGNGDLNVKYYSGKFDAYQRTYIVESKDNDTLLVPYLYYFLDGYVETLREQSIGGVIKYIKLGNLTEADIPLPDINRQSNIVKRLTKVEKLISLRKQQLAKLDELVKARFVEMFGDPLEDTNKWERIKWDGVFATTTGKLDSNAAVSGGKYPFFTCAKEWLWIDTYAFDCEALLLAGNNAAGIYDVKHYKGKFNAYQRTYVLTLKNSDWRYPLFKYQLESRLNYLQSQSKGTNTRYLTLGILQVLDFIVPPPDLQSKFSIFTEKVDQQKLTVRQSLDQLKILKKSLMQEYFG